MHFGKICKSSQAVSAMMVRRDMAELGNKLHGLKSIYAWLWSDNNVLFVDMSV